MTSNSIQNPSETTKLKLLILAIQHIFTMFGATILVPILTGLNVSVALFTAGIGTLFFNRVTKNKVPVFLGSSFAYIGIINIVKEKFGLEYALGGIFFVGIIYVIMAIIVYKVGVDKVCKVLPAQVTYPLIIVIGIGLAPTAIDMASQNWYIATMAIVLMILIGHFSKGFLKIIPVITTLIISYLICLVFNQVDTSILTYKFVGIPEFMFPKFNLDAILMVLPVSIVTILEHIGDIEGVSLAIGKDIKKEVGLHRTLIGDGIATSLASLFGGPANTTYSENTGVLILTKATNPIIMVLAGFISVLLAFNPFLASLIKSIPTPIIGGISIILFGSIASVGIRGIKESSFEINNKNLLIMSIILVFGIGIEEIALFGFFNVSGLSLGAFVGILLNLIIKDKENVSEINEKAINT